MVCKPGESLMRFEFLMKSETLAGFTWFQIPLQTFQAPRSLKAQILSFTLECARRSQRKLKIKKKKKVKTYSFHNCVYNQLNDPDKCT